MFQKQQTENRGTAYPHNDHDFPHTSSHPCLFAGSPGARHSTRVSETLPSSANSCFTYPSGASSLISAATKLLPQNMISSASSFICSRYKFLLTHSDVENVMLLHYDWTYCFIAHFCFVLPMQDNSITFRFFSLGSFWVNIQPVQDSLFVLILQHPHTIWSQVGQWGTV